MATELNLGDYLEDMPETEAVPADVLRQVIEKIGSRPPADFPNPASINRALRGTFKDKEVRGKIARDVFDYLKENVFVGGAATAAPAAAMPTKLVIEERATPASMTLRQLLAELADPESAYEEDELLQFALSSTDYRTALTITLDLAVQKEGGTDGKLVLDGIATYDYIRELVDYGSDAVVEEIDGHPVVTLEEALGKTRQLPVSAFTGRGVPPKPDKYGIAWGAMDKKLHLAMLLGATEGSDLMPQTESERRAWGRLIAAGETNDDMTALTRWYDRRIARGAKAPERFAIRQPQAPQSSGGPYVPGGVMPPFQGAPPLGRGQELPPRPWNPSGR